MSSNSIFCLVHHDTLCLTNCSIICLTHYSILCLTAEASFASPAAASFASPNVASSGYPTAALPTTPSASFPASSTLVRNLITNDRTDRIGKKAVLVKLYKSEPVWWEAVGLDSANVMDPTMITTKDIPSSVYPKTGSEVPIGCSCVGSLSDQCLMLCVVRRGGYLGVSRVSRVKKYIK